MGVVWSSINNNNDNTTDDVQEIERRIAEKEDALAEGDERFRQIIEFKRQNLSNILAIDPNNIVYCGVGLKITNGIPNSGSLCVRIYVRKKLPRKQFDNEATKARLIPSFIGSFATDVDEISTTQTLSVLDNENEID